MNWVKGELFGQVLFNLAFTFFASNKNLTETHILVHRSACVTVSFNVNDKIKEILRPNRGIDRVF